MIATDDGEHCLPNATHWHAKTTPASATCVILSTFANESSSPGWHHFLGRPQVLIISSTKVTAIPGRRYFNFS